MPRSAEPGRAARWLPVAAALLIAGVFMPAVGFGFVNWDDDLHVYRNPLVLSGGSWTDLLLTPRLGYPIPVTVFGYRVEAAMVGLRPWLFHLTNVVLHLGSSGLVYLLARGLGLARPGATSAMLLFGLHPVAAEPVSWVTGRKDVLALFLALTATLLFLQSCDRANRQVLRQAGCPTVTPTLSAGGADTEGAITNCWLAAPPAPVRWAAVDAHRSLPGALRRRTPYSPAGLGEEHSGPWPGDPLPPQQECPRCPAAERA